MLSTQEMPLAPLVAAEGLASTYQGGPDMSDGTRTIDRPEGTTAEQEACLCDFYEISPVAHDGLLAFEETGVTGVAALLEYLGMAEEAEEPQAERWIHWLEFPRFVREHNWTDPLAVSRLTTDIDQLFRLRRAEAHRSAGPGADEVEATITRLEEQAARLDEKLALVAERLTAPGATLAEAVERDQDSSEAIGDRLEDLVEAGDTAGIAAELPNADLSPAHIAELVEGLPADVVAEIDATARLAEELAWHADLLVGRWNALEDALSEAVGSDKVDNGGDLVRAVEGSTGAEVVEEVLTALGLTGCLPCGGRLEILRSHAVEPREGS